MNIIELVFNLSIVTYSNDSRNLILNVPKKIINKFGAVSEECCLSMVKNLAKISKSQVNVSITGIAGPKGGSNLKPVGLVFIGAKLSSYDSEVIAKLNFGDIGRKKIQQKSVNEALKMSLSLLEDS